ncbi:hypothetical protein GQ55_2G034200 [Panicum hallii var. hallii]|uniref:Uncharacterized protein n=1 Tax=Panicum hallii var. hallii TaxID=1504633 RepID=A0A2T7EL09_9POAL|nr:hypothetical protein GQ55_2G034200 [Panicum hallii var. hallii]
MSRIQLRKLFFWSGKWTSASSPLRTNWRALRRTRPRKLFRLLGPMSTSCSTGTATSSTSTSSSATAGSTPPPPGQRTAKSSASFHLQLQVEVADHDARRAALPGEVGACVGAGRPQESRGPPPPPGAFAMPGRERARGSRRKEGLTCKARGFTEKYRIAINNRN